MEIWTYLIKDFQYLLYYIELFLDFWSSKLQYSLIFGNDVSR